jgi:hypothetical protein
VISIALILGFEALVLFDLGATHFFEKTVLCTVCYVMAGALTLYYRSLGIASTLLRRGNISGRPYMGVMTYKTLSFPASKQLGSYRRFYTIEL